MIEKIRNENTNRLFQAILTLQNLDECYAFFDDLCTKKELDSLAQRLAVAKMLFDKRVYSEIVLETGTSTATISRVNRSISNGNDGYQMVFDRMRK